MLIPAGHRCALLPILHRLPRYLPATGAFTNAVFLNIVLQGHGVYHIPAKDNWQVDLTGAKHSFTVRGMRLPNDLRDYRADDPFQLLTPDLCVVLLCAIAFLGYLLLDVLRIW